MESYFFAVKGMTVGYDGVPLIKDIDISLEKGEILTLIGPNGAGKSTILKSIIGQLALIGGTVFLEKESLDGMSEQERAKRLSVVLTERIRPELMTVMDVVATGRYPYTGRLGILSGEDKRIVRETMEWIGIVNLAEQDFLTLSDGQRQRVMLARAIAQEPEILVLDEPTSYLDIRYKLEFLSLLQKLTKKKKLTVIMSLHELDLAERISDKLVCVKGEYVERVGTPETVFESGYISRLYDMTEGSFDERSGRAELQKAVGMPEVFVIAGGGTGIPVYRRLQRRGIPFVTGILWENDQDMPVADALAVRVIREKAFHKAEPETLETAKQEIDACKEVICTLEEFGELNPENEQLLRYAKAKGKLRENEGGKEQVVGWQR